MSIIQDIIDLTEKTYSVDVSKNVKLDGSNVIFYSDDNFDWFAEGVFIYFPEFEAEKDPKSGKPIGYKPVGYSYVYENQDDEEMPRIYIRADYDKLLSNTYKKYCVTDFDSETNEYDFTSYVLMANC